MDDIERAFDSIKKNTQSVEQYVSDFHDECAALADEIYKTAVSEISRILDEQITSAIIADDYQGKMTATQYIAFRLDRGWIIDDISPLLQSTIDAFVEQYLNNLSQAERFILRNGSGYCGQVLANQEVEHVINDRLFEYFSELAENLPLEDLKSREFYLQYEEQRLSLPTKKLSVSSSEELKEDLLDYLTELWLETYVEDRKWDLESTLNYAKYFAGGPFYYDRSSIESDDERDAYKLMESILWNLDDAVSQLLSSVKYPLASSLVNWDEQGDFPMWSEVMLAMLPTLHDD